MISPATQLLFNRLESTIANAFGEAEIGQSEREMLLLIVEQITFAHNRKIREKKP